jgi:hypothetical protein
MSYKVVVYLGRVPILLVLRLRRDHGVTRALEEAIHRDLPHPDYTMTILPPAVWLTRALERCDGSSNSYICASIGWIWFIGSEIRPNY